MYALHTIYFTIATHVPCITPVNEHCLVVAIAAVPYSRFFGFSTVVPTRLPFAFAWLSSLCPPIVTPSSTLFFCVFGLVLYFNTCLPFVPAFRTFLQPPYPITACHMLRVTAQTVCCL